MARSKRISTNFVASYVIENPRALLFIAAALLFFTTLFSSHFASARTFRIFEVRKNLPLTDDEAVIHDYYLNAGLAQGLKAGMTIPVNRKEAVHDFYGDNEDDLLITIGRLKLITVQENISVGRLVPISDERKIASTPVLDFATVMIGDRVDIAGAKGDDDGDGNGNGAGGGSGAGIGKGAGLGFGGSAGGVAANAAGTESGSLNPVAAPTAPTGEIAKPQTAAQTKAPQTVSPMEPLTATAPKVTMEPMVPAQKAPSKQASTREIGSVPKLELRSPDDFKDSASPTDGSLVNDESAPDLNPL